MTGPDWDVEFAQYQDLGDKGLLPTSWPYAVRVDGRAFHTFTRPLDQPFDLRLVEAFDYATRVLIDQIDGAVVAYAQSDEVSILIPGRRDGKPHWFGSRPMKIATVAASEFTAAFNVAFRKALDNSLNPVLIRPMGGTFDARIVPLPGDQTVVDYLTWRHADAVRNGITQVASQYASHKQLHGVPLTDRRHLIEAQGDDLDRYRPHVHGRITTRHTYTTDVEWTDKRGDKHVAENVTRHRWEHHPVDRDVDWAAIWKEATA